LALPPTSRRLEITDTLTIRLAEPRERHDLEQLQLRASLNNPGDRDAILANPDAIELPTDQIVAGQVFVAERNGAVVGFAAVLDRDDRVTELDGLFVEPTCWRCGVGRALVDRCADYGRERNARAIHVVGNPHALAFYKAYGFVGVGTYQTRFGIGILMSKSIA
jgi:GNAT superfamily N-acetyltransferase